MDAIILASMTENIINFFRNLIGNDVITIILVSMIPIVELRGAIPMAIQMGIPPFLSFLYSYLGCAIVIPILLLILKPIINWMKRTRGFKTFALAVEGVFQGKVDKMEKNAAKSEVTLSSDDLDLSGEKAKRARKLEIKKLIAVGVFVALPIPMTGVWTGSAIAAFMGLTFWKSFAVIMLGNVVAGSIILLLSVFLKPYLDTILFWFFMLVLLVLAVFIVKIVVKVVKIRLVAEKKILDEKNIEKDEKIAAIKDARQAEEDSKINEENALIGGAYTTEGKVMSAAMSELEKDTAIDNADYDMLKKDATTNEQCFFDGKVGNKVAEDKDGCLHAQVEDVDDILEEINREYREEHICVDDKKNAAKSTAKVSKNKKK